MNTMAGEAIEVPFSDDESVTDDQLIVEADKPGDSPEVKAQRASRRRERAQERERERKEQGARLERLEGELAQERAERARLQGYVAAIPVGNQQPGKDPYDTALDAVYERRSQAYKTLVAETQGGKVDLDPKRQAYFDRESRDIEGEIARIHAQKAVDQRVPQQRQEAAQQQWVSKYPDVYNNAPAFEYAKGRFQSRQALARARGETLTNDVVDEIMQETQAEFKLGRKPAPSRSDREKFSGMSSGGGGGGNAEAGRGIAMTKELRLMAVARYGSKEVSDEAAVKKWVENEGRALRAQKVL